MTKASFFFVGEGLSHMLAICISSENLPIKSLYYLKVICRHHKFEKGTLRVIDCSFRQPSVSLVLCCCSRWGWSPVCPMSHLPALHGCPWCVWDGTGHLRWCRLTGPFVEVSYQRGKKKGSVWNFHIRLLSSFRYNCARSRKYLCWFWRTRKT